MVHITSYHSDNFGFTFPSACIEVLEVTSRKNQEFYTGEGSANTLVRLRIWATEQAKEQGRQPIEVIERYADLDDELINEIHQNSFTLLFPQV
ncbi:MAG: hypothetical protein ACXIUD_09835 [Mongoliitalea sp.]